MSAPNPQLGIAQIPEAAIAAKTAAAFNKKDNQMLIHLS